MIIIFSAPSGSGKSTLVNYILEQKPQDISFSISATTRKPRGTEENGKEYYFLSIEEFKTLINNNELLEYQEVYPGCFYGTLRSEVNRLENEGKHIIFDMDVFGGINLKKLFGSKAISIFVKPPSLEILRQRLYSRGTDAEDIIKLRLQKANEELKCADQFDYTILNDNLDSTKEQALTLINNFLNNSGLD